MFPLHSLKKWKHKHLMVSLLCQSLKLLQSQVFQYKLQIESANVLWRAPKRPENSLIYDTRQRKQIKRL